jgi:uncharacterized protein (TIGR03067 family)
MRRSFIGLLAIAASLTALAAADDAKDEAIRKDRNLIEGTWRVVSLEVNGEKFKEDDAKALTVVNGADGSWSLRDQGDERSKGTSTIDPTKNPKNHRLHHDHRGRQGQAVLRNLRTR